MLRLHGDQAKVVAGDELLIKRDFEIWNGEGVVIEAVATIEEAHTLDGSVAAAEYEISRNKITIRCNRIGSSEYDVELQVDKRDTLQSLKDHIASLFELPDVEKFRLRSSKSAPDI